VSGILPPPPVGQFHFHARIREAGLKKTGIIYKVGRCQGWNRTTILQVCRTRARARAHIVVAGDGFDGPHFKNPLWRPSSHMAIEYGPRRIDIVPPPVRGANRGRTSQRRQMLCLKGKREISEQGKGIVKPGQESQTDCSYFFRK